MPAGCDPGLARAAAGLAAAGALLSDHLHASGWLLHCSLPPPTHDLLAALPGLGCGAAATRPRSTLRRWADRDDWGFADLDPRSAFSSACPLSGARDWAGRGWGAAPAAQSGLPGRGQ